ncbi:MAG: hypothetical protein ACIAQZ_12360, partial [Sedimentisphaeraceae bacterium JB056]
SKLVKMLPVMEKTSFLTRRSMNTMRNINACQNKGKLRLENLANGITRINHLIHHRIIAKFVFTVFEYYLQ